MILKNKKWLFILAVISLLAIFAFVAGYFMKNSLSNNENYAKYLNNYQLTLVKDNIQINYNTNYEVYIVYNVIEGEGSTDVFIFQVNKKDKSTEIIYENYTFNKSQIISVETDNNINLSFSEVLKYNTVLVDKNKIYESNLEELTLIKSKLNNKNYVFKKI